DTFSVGFTEAGESNELADARFVANTLGANHHEIELSFADEPTPLDRLIWHLDEPLADLSSLGFLALSELASEHVTVALSGQGADELLGGYRKHRVASLAGHWENLPAVVRAAGGAALRRGPGQAAQLAEALQSPDPVARLLASSGIVHPDLRDG